MAKKKSEIIEQEAVFEEAPVEVIEENIVEEVVEPVATEQPSGDAFRDRTLKAINQMENKAKAKRLADRLMRKKARKH